MTKPISAGRILARLLGASALGAIACAGAALAQAYPDKTISMVVPFAAGGPTDVVARLAAESMSKTLGQQVIVENVAGAGGTIGVAKVARAAPDGYTLLLHHIGMATAPTLYRKLPYDAKTDFAPISVGPTAPMTIVGRIDFEPKDLAEVVAYVKKNGDKVTFGNAGMGAASHLCGMLFQSAVGAPMTTVPYKGTGPMMQDLRGKTIDLSCDQTTNTTGPIKDKAIKAYAATTRQRLKTFPDLPTADEAGLKGFEVGVWHGLYAPKGAPPEAIKKLNAAFRDAMKDEKVVKRLDDLGVIPPADDQMTPQAMQSLLDSEIARWAPIIKAAGQYAD